MNPLLKLIEPLTGIVNTGLSIIRDKTKDPEMSFINEKVKNGISISSKRVLNLTGTAAMIGMALSDMVVNGITWEAVGLAALGAFYSVAMAYMTGKSEAE